jgi:hypothetical protein
MYLENGPWRQVSLLGTLRLCEVGPSRVMKNNPIGRG